MAPVKLSGGVLPQGRPPEQSKCDTFQRHDAAF
jgi:hypothetical protein